MTSEICLLVSLFFLEYVRLYLGYKGNLTENKKILILSVVFSLPSFFGCLYIAIWQTLIYKLEVIISSVQLVFICVGIVMCLIV
uniref:Uncharacterized protein n=1 Tax=Helobdella robusta TaxID=6412 RepID=T1FX93_HELRO